MYSFSELVYYSSLLACISLGSYYKKIEDPVTKRSYGTGLGVLITCMICGPSVVHSVLMVWGNIIIIKCCKKQYIHHLSLAYTWLYLIYLNFNLDVTNNVLWIHQAVALRLVGLAFEINMAEKARRQPPPKVATIANNSIPNIDEVANKLSNQAAQHATSVAKNSANKFTLSDMGFVPTEPSAVDIIAYAYYFIGLHKGPYYRWKIFNEHFKTPFGVLGDCRIITEQKLKKAFVCGLVYLFLSRKFPVQVYYENDFYLKHGTDFRYLYNIPQMFIYVLQYQVLMMLCTSVCTETGFGVYPTKTQPLPGHGPSTRFSLLNLATVTEEVALEQEYNFAMLRSFENEKLLIGPRMRDTLRGWDMSTRYWFWAYTYKGMVKTNKEVRCVFAQYVSGYIHHLSLAYTWLYLIYLNFNLDVTNNVLWIHQAVALRLVGLAFEINMAEKARRQPPPKVATIANNSIPNIDEVANKLSNQAAQHATSVAKNSANKFTLSDMGFVPTEPSAVDIIAYAYYFIGLHKGPYYRWKIFNEHFKTPFGVLGDCRIITEQKLKKAFVCGLVYLFLSRKFPVQVYYENDFYLKHGTDFRYLYNIPQMFIYVLQYQVLMMLCTSVCTETGFGVYPTKTQPLPGHGPSTRFSLLNLATVTEEVALEQEYNFAMLRSFENEKLLIGPRMRDTLRGWDMSTRYWFWAYTYKGMVKTNKEVRCVFAQSALSFLAWTVWCGPTLQQLIISATLWVHLHLEYEYGELYDTNVSMKIPWDIGFSIMRLFCLTYLTPCLILKDSAVVLRYYNSIFWVYHMVLLFLILGAVGVYKERTLARSSL
uniref:Lysophospholipid acyltransferase 7 n=1 Tax=Heliothis virescens TaxID=7102 RepID=A0A2A4IYZ5_HELVI